MPKVIELKKKTVATEPPSERPPRESEPSEVAWAEAGIPKGGPLMAVLMQSARERDQTLADLAAELDVTYGYIVQMRNGARSSANISDAFAARCARYLGLPRLTVLMLAGRVTSADFFEEDALNYMSLTRAYEHIRSDPYWGPRAPALSKEEAERHPGLLTLAVWLYEDVTGTTLLPGVTDPRDLARAIDALRGQQNKKPKRS
jgi:transcriptional regulator with XRE-family HTH domain